jgi:hypothetical protein
VGTFAVQLAHWRGARVTGTASARSASDLQAEGADEVIDYRTTRFEDVVHDADVVLDTIGGDTLARSWGVLKRGGTLVSIVATPSPQEATAHGVRGVTFIVEPNRAELIEIGRLVDAHVVRPIVEAVRPRHPSLVDDTHRMDALFGVDNIPQNLWIDEDGMIVRPPHTAAVERYDFSKLKAPEGLPDDLDAHIRDMLEQVKRIPRFDADHYVEALRDWVEHGAGSRYALAPDEVVGDSAPRSRAAAEAAAEFDLGQYLHHAGFVEDARTHFRAAHRLQPENWTYKRNAWELVSPGIQGPTEFYDGDWLADIKAAGPENYYASPGF